MHKDHGIIVLEPISKILHGRVARDFLVPQGATRKLVPPRTIDEEHNAALWATVREAFDYPLFVAAPKSVGITSTGETGETVPNELPKVLEAYGAFAAWVEAGSKPEDRPSFQVPSAA